jgi:hypothetical protein
MKRTIALVAAAIGLAGCGGSNPAVSNPAAKLIMRTGAAQYEQAGNPKVVSADCKRTTDQNYTCEMRYAFTTNGKRTELQSTVPVSCSGKSCTANWGSATEGETVGASGKVVATATSSQLPSKLTNLEQCISTEGQYTKLAGALRKFSISAPQSVFGNIVAQASSLNTDLLELSAKASVDQQAQLTQYEGVVSQLETATRDASAGDFQGADESLTGIAQQIGQIPTLVNQICGA